MRTHWDAVVIGGGFKGMMTAHGLSSKGLNVTILEKGGLLGGFMAPINWRGVDIDKGPQFLDGMNISQKIILDEIMKQADPLTSLDFSYSSFWNGVVTPGFAIPDYRSLPLRERAMVLFETIACPTLITTPNTVEDLYSVSQPETLAHIDRWCKKFLLTPAAELSCLNTKFATFFGRKLLLNNDQSLILKELPALDALFAAKKQSVDHGTYNLYPKGKNMGYFRTVFESVLVNSDVDIKLKTEVLRIDLSGKGLAIHLDGGGVITANQLFCAGPIECTESLLLGGNIMRQVISPVSQVFYLIELPSEPDLPFYVMNYDDASIARVTNFTKYAGKGKNAGGIICVEVPAEINSEIWKNPEAHYPIVVSELADMGLNIEDSFFYQSFRIPSTYRVLKPNYIVEYEVVLRKIQEKFGGTVEVLTPHTLTRASIMADLQARAII